MDYRAAVAPETVANPNVRRRANASTLPAIAHAAPTRNETRQSAVSTSTPATALPADSPITSAVIGHV